MSIDGVEVPKESNEVEKPVKKRRHRKLRHTTTTPAQKAEWAAKMKEYFSQWYEKNRAELSKRRKERYQQDTEYRSKVLAMSQKSRARTAPKGDNKITVGGIEYTLLSLIDVANLVQVSRDTVLSWEKIGLLPVTPFRLTTKKSRYYTKDMMLTIRRAIRKFKSDDKRVHINRQSYGFRKMIETGWSELPELAGHEVRLLVVADQNELKSYTQNNLVIPASIPVKDI